MVLESLMVFSAGVMAFLFCFIVMTNLVVVSSLFVRKKSFSFEPKVSVVIPVFNEGKNIVNCLDAVLSSEYPKNKFEVIVVDDGSTDNSVNIVKNYAGVRLVSSSHKGKSVALNNGILAAKYDFVVTLDADTVVEKGCLKTIVGPMADAGVGAVAGLTKVKNDSALLGMFQSVEYFYNNLVRMAFSRVFNHTVWFHGAIACYRKSALKDINFFKAATLAEDLDVSMEMLKFRYRTVHADAVAYTKVPTSVFGLVRQRIRWSVGVFQSLEKNKSIIPKTAPVWIFVRLNQWWWCLFALISFPLFAVQIAYWFPQSGSFVDVSVYFARWFSLWGPAYVVYKLPVWGVSVYSIFGVLAGLLTSIFLIISVCVFEKRARLQHVVALFFYFPYTLLINLGLIASVLSYKFYKGAFFIR